MCRDGGQEVTVTRAELRSSRLSGKGRVQLEDHIAGSWAKGIGSHAELHDAFTGEFINTTVTGGLDLGGILSEPMDEPTRLNAIHPQMAPMSQIAQNSLAFICVICAIGG
ncbi:MAG: hypothetical protein H6592_06595 [Flavobacteriales bacterium]|nr:hypothetical protein [Flavobacteriales bacterium]